MNENEFVKPLCSIYQECGGCCYQDLRYADELNEKQKIVEMCFTREGLEHVLPHIQTIVPSPKEYHYRHRIDLKLIRTRAEDVFIGYSPMKRRGVIPIKECAIAMSAVSQYIPQLHGEATEKLTPKYRQANLVVRCGDEGKVFWGGIGKKSLQMKECDYLWTEVYGRKIFYSLDTFFQANLSILSPLMQHIRDLDVWEDHAVLYDLYGGVGLFSFGLFDLVEKVVLIENNPASIGLAKYNATHHNVKHIKILEGKVEDYFDDLMTEHDSFHKVVFIDPPRAGLSEDARVYFASQTDVDVMIYLSCHPETLARDLIEFQKKDWIINSVTPFDFFPKTRHVETLVVLKR